MPHMPTASRSRKFRYKGLYSASEQKFMLASQRVRTVALIPVAALLARLGITPDMLSFASVVCGVGFFALAVKYFTLALWLLAISIVLDGFDGSLARYTRVASNRGSFTDMFADGLVVALSVAGMVRLHLIDPVLSVVFVYIYTALVIFLILHGMLQVSSKWIIRPSRMVLYLFLYIYAFFHINWLNGLLIVYLISIPMLLLSFYRIRRVM